jgi:MSHA biogenesis protein MshP
MTTIRIDSIGNDSVRLCSVRRLRRNTGVGLVTAIFLLVVLSGLAVAMVAISSAQHVTSALDVQGARAYQAARAGIEWGLFQSMRNGSCIPRPGTSFALPATSSLSGFVVTVTCTTIVPAGAPADASAALVRRVLNATACNLPAANGACPNASNNPDYVERQIVVTI